VAPIRNPGSRPAPSQPKSPPPAPKSAPAQSQAAAQKPAQKPAQAQAAQKPAQAQATQTAAGDRFVPERNTKNFSNGVRNDMNRLANSDKATHTANHDGSSTSTRTATDSKGVTRTAELTTQKGDLAHSNIKYTTSAKNQNEEIKNTYTSQSDILGRTQSSHTREHSKTDGDTTTTHSEAKTTGRFGLQKSTETDTYKVTHGDNSKTESSAITTDRYGNRSTTDTTTNTTKNGNTTVTQTRKDTSGAEVKTEPSVKFEEGKFTVGESVERKDNRFSTERSISRETELLPSREDKGFSQTRNGAVSRAQTAGNVLDAAGAKVELHKYEVPKDKLKEHNLLGDDPNNFIGTRKGYTGSEEVTFGLGGVNASYKREAVIGAYAESKGDHHSTTTKIEGKATVEGKAKVDSNGVDTSGSVKLGVGAEVSGTLKAERPLGKYGDSEPKVGVEGTVKATAQASLEANGKVKITRNPPTAIVEGQAGASAVAKVEAELKGTAGPFSVKANVYGSAGAEAKIGGSIGFEDGKLKLSGNLGAAVGLGAGAGANVEIDVKMIGDIAKAKATEAADINGDGKLGMDDAKAIANEVRNSVSNTVNEAANKVKGWFGW
jgi:hypothetical protein